MTIFNVEIDGTLVKQFKAEDFFDKGDMIYFTDEQNATVGSIVKRPGMSVTKEGHDGAEN